MRSAKLIHVVSCHAEGEVGDVIVGGVAPPPGATLWEQSRFIAADQTLRNFLLNETARRGFPARQPARAAQGFSGGDGVHHHGADGHAADVRLELDLRRDRAARHRDFSDAGAADAPHAGGAGRRDRGGRGLSRRQGGADHRDQRALVRRSARRQAGGRGARNIERRHRLRRRQFRHRRGLGAGLCDPAGRGARTRRGGGENHGPPPRPNSVSTTPTTPVGTTSRSVSSPGRSPKRRAR